MKRRTLRIYQLTALALCIIVQLAGSLFRTHASTPPSNPSPTATAQAGEWQFLETERWDQPRAYKPNPGDGEMGIKVIQFDERGGEIEATIRQAQYVCGNRSGETEVIGVKWTFTTPILHLRPGDVVPIDIAVRLVKASQFCRHAEGFTEAYLSWSGGPAPPSMPATQYWSLFSSPAPGIPRFNFYISPDASSGRSAFKINPSPPTGDDPKLGWFALSLKTSSTWGENQFVHFFYKYRFGGAGNKYAIQTSSGNYLTAVNGGGIRGPGAICTNATRIQAWETFTLLDQGGGKFAIQTANGNYLTAVNGGGVGGPNAIHTDATRIQGWELFTLVPQPGGTYAIQTANGRYLTALNGGGKCTGDTIHTDATSINTWERFRLVPVT